MRDETGDRKTKRYLGDMTRVLLAVFMNPGMTTRQLSEAIGIDYEKNGSHRCMYWFHNIEEFVCRHDDGPNGSYTWWPRRKWINKSPVEVRRLWLEANPETLQ